MSLRFVGTFVGLLSYSGSAIAFSTTSLSLLQKTSTCSSWNPVEDRRRCCRGTTRLPKLRLVGNDSNQSDRGTTKEFSENPFESFLASFLSLPEKPTAVPQEIDQERNRRLALERREKLEQVEVLRQERVRDDVIAYLVLAALQLLPLFGTDRLTKRKTCHEVVVLL